jgi:hypothetical protein
MEEVAPQKMILNIEGIGPWLKILTNIDIKGER